jgi:hypothetical protein
LSTGAHTYQVRATDVAGNVDPTPAPWNWTVTVTSPVTLKGGWTLISLPVQPTSPLTASDVISNINSQLGAGTATLVQRWNGSGWETYDPTVPPSPNFSIDLGKAYFVKTTIGGTWSVEGTPVNGMTLTYDAGFSGVGVPFGSYTAASLVAALGPSVKNVRRWDGSQWVTYLVGMPFNNFSIVSGQGYFIKSDLAGSKTLP